MSQNPEALFRSFAHDAPALMWISRPDGIERLFNPAWLEFTGRTRGAQFDDNWLNSVCAEDRSAIADRVMRAVERREPFTAEYRLLRADGQLRWMLDHGQPWTRDDRVLGFLGSCIDITDRKAQEVDAYERLRESNDQLRRLAARVEAGREEERAAVAREIHDELGQTLTALKLEMKRAVDLLRHGPAIDRLQSMIGLCEWAIQSIQRIATTLRPATLDHLGLPEAIRWEADAFRSRTNVRCRVVTDSEITSLGIEQQTAVFRIFQEALRNVERHANASAVTVRLREDHERFELAIHDNGRGIRPDDLSGPRALGVLGMRERAELIGGSFAIDGSARGTTITVHVPAPSLVRQERTR